MDDYSYENISYHLRFGKYPPCFKNRPGAKSNLRNKSSAFLLAHGVLYRKLKDKDHSVVRVIQTETEQQNILKACHDGLGSTPHSKALGGHTGYDKMELKLRRRFWWPNMRNDIREYIRTCERCQKGSSRFDKAAPTLHPIPVPTGVWQNIGVDVCSLPESTDGFVAIVVAVDYFSKWLEAKPLRQKTAHEVALFLYELVCRHGCPLVQINDQGREFVNKVSERLFHLTGTKQRITSAYHPQANGLVERNNRTIQAAMLKTLEGERDAWPLVLQGTLFAYRTSVQKSTGYSPFYLMYGRHPVLPVDIRASTPEDEPLQEEAEDTANTAQVSQRIKSFQLLTSEVFAEAGKNIKKSQDTQKRDYEKRHSNRAIHPVGSKVLLWNLRRADRKGDKCSDPWEGPFIVESIKENGTYQLKTVQGKILKQKAHGCNLKPWNERATKNVDGNEKSNFSPRQAIPEKTRQHHRKPDIQAPITYDDGMCQLLVMKSGKVLQRRNESGVKLEKDSSKDSEDFIMHSLQEKEMSTWSPSDPMWQAIQNIDIEAPTTASCDDGTHKTEGHDDESQHYIIICTEEAGDPSLSGTIWQQHSTLGIQAPITSPRNDTTHELTTEIDDGSEDLIILSVQEAETLTFNPPKKTWQEQQCRNLGIKAAITACKYTGRGARMKTDESPTAVVQIKPDGNCFFRSMSVVLTGSQESHMVCRNLVVKWIDEHKDTFRDTFVDGSIEAHIEAMRRNGVWATTAEIVALASCTGTPVAVFAPLGPKSAWQIHNPLDSTSQSEFTIYLVNHCEHFEVVSSVS